MSNPWKYDDESITSLPESCYGFVYKITCMQNNRIYIGKKCCSKGVKWQSYYGSSAELKADIKQYGKDSFRREILYMCESQRELTYLETKTQFELGVLESDTYYNSNILGKFYKKWHLKRQPFSG